MAVARVGGCVIVCQKSVINNLLKSPDKTRTIPNILSRQSDAKTTKATKSIKPAVRAQSLQSRTAPMFSGCIKPVVRIKPVVPLQTTSKLQDAILK